MKSIFTISLLIASMLSASAQHRSKEELDKLIPLNSFKEKSAGIKTVNPKLSSFERTLFCIGSIQAIPNKHTVVSSRIAGRVVTAPPVVGDIITAGQTVLEIESRQPGSPPPRIPTKAVAGGVVFESHVKLGQPVEPSQELMDIVDISQVWAIANVPESHASSLALGQKARIHVVSLGKLVITGKLIKFGTQADSSSGTIQAIFLLDNKDLKLRPNMRTEFSIVTSSRDKVLSIPKSAIQGGKLDAHVFCKDYELKHTYKKVNVLIGEENDQFVEILPQKNGLNLFDDVVVQGGYFISHSGPDKTSLKKFLDDAHGHEHNEDGSEITEDQQKEKEANSDTQQSGKGKFFIPLVTTNIITILLLIFTIFRKKDVS